VPGSVYRVRDFDLASRLSFFLWSSAPDDELLGLAAQRKVSQPAVLNRQVQRMLRDPRSNTLVTNFAAQWLYLRNLDSVNPTPRLFPEFDDNLRQALRRETELFVESVIGENRPVLDLLNADYTFINERLARHYGIPGVLGDYFRRVTLTDPNRRGLLGQGSILALTSYPTRTSPVLRGKWILDNIVGAPPPPPPPDVPELKDPPVTNVTSMRDRMGAHRANPVCAGCHARMDPLGLALENFDAIGRWRSVDASVTISPNGALRPLEADTAIDASGTLPNGTKFDGPSGLRAALLSHPEQFVQTVTERLLTYALGRGLEPYDAPAVRAITREAARNEYRFGTIVLGVVKSIPFQMRKAEEAPAPPTVAARSQRELCCSMRRVSEP
jgi:hypothetical protein